MYLRSDLGSLVLGFNIQLSRICIGIHLKTAKVEVPTMYICIICFCESCNSPNLPPRHHSASKSASVFYQKTRQKKRRKTTNTSNPEFDGIATVGVQRVCTVRVFQSPPHRNDPSSEGSALAAVPTDSFSFLGIHQISGGGVGADPPSPLPWVLPAGGRGSNPPPPIPVPSKAPLAASATSASSSTVTWLPAPPPTSAPPSPPEP